MPHPSEMAFGCYASSLSIPHVNLMTKVVRHMSRAQVSAVAQRSH